MMNGKRSIKRLFVAVTVGSVVLWFAEPALGEGSEEGPEIGSQIAFDPVSHVSTSVDVEVVVERLNLAAVGRELRITKAKQEILRKWIDQQPQDLEEVVWGLNPLLAELREKRERIEKEIDLGMNTGGQMTEEHPKVMMWRNQIKEIDQAIAEAPKQVVISRSRRINEVKLAAERDLQELAAAVAVLAEEKRMLEAATGIMKQATQQLGTSEHGLTEERKRIESGGL